MEQNEKSLTTKRIIIYLAITFGVTYLLSFAVIYPAVSSISVGMQMLGQLLVGSIMFIPAIGVLLTRLITKEGFKDSYIVPKTGKKSIPYFLFGWFGPWVLIILGAIVFYVIFPDKFDSGMSYMAATLSAQGTEVTADMLKMTMIAQSLTALLIGPLLNIFTCFGEEWGWRGYLLPKMQEKFSLPVVLLVNGIIWGLWHAPLTAIGHNYGVGYWGYPFTGILAMCCFCIVIGVIFTFITIRTGSCLPAALAHGSLNGFAAAPLFFADINADISPFVGPASTGIIGGSAFIVCAIIMAVIMIKDTQKTA